ncbi:MAG: sigma-E factor negative regulatory protein RseA [Gammaproteobacteria bacterium]|jgi:sigma-E factor negative regulatory protein RseA
MTEQKEQLSSLLDDHLTDESSGLISDVIRDVNLQYQLRRYRMIGEVVRNELPGQIKMDFHQSVMREIQDLNSDSTATAVNSEAKSRPGFSHWLTASWFRPIAGFAVAATVAVVTITLWQSISSQQLNGGQVVSAEEKKIQQLAGQTGVSSVIPASSTLQDGTRWKLEGNPDLQLKLNAYLVNHTEYSNSVQGLIPQARVAGFDSEFNNNNN